MDEIKDVIAGLIQNYEVIRESEVLMSKEANSIGKCPLCGSAVEDKYKGCLLYTSDDPLRKPHFLRFYRIELLATAFLLLRENQKLKEGWRLLSLIHI